MKSRYIFFAVILLAFTLIMPSSAHAKLTDKVWDAIQNAYRPAVWNKGLESAYVNPDPSKFRGYVVVDQGGIAAARAKRVISWAEYDYRGVKIDLEKDTVKNRRGSIYTYLQRGDVMAVAKIDKLLNNVYISLISPEIYKPANRSKDKHFSRVTTLLIFKVPKEMAESADASVAIKAIGKWIRPFNNYADAKDFSNSIRPEGFTIGNPESPAEVTSAK